MNHKDKTIAIPVTTRDKISSVASTDRLEPDILGGIPTKPPSNVSRRVCIPFINLDLMLDELVDGQCEETGHEGQRSEYDGDDSEADECCA